jgi:ABC-type dipeptide/oligopeptide/nickel transport system permease subunit
VTALDSIGLKGKAAAPPEEPRSSELGLAFAAVRRDRLAMAGAIILAVVILATIFAPWISPYSPSEAHRAVGRLAPPLTPGHLLGTDGQSRDVLSRLIWGGRVSLPVAAVPIILSSMIGLVLGLLASQLGGWIGAIIMRFFDVLFAFPGVMLAIAVAATLGPGLMNCMLAMTIVITPYVGRLVYTEAVRLRRSDFVDAARVAGMRTWGIVFREIMPNVLSPVIVYGTTSLGGMVVFAAGLSFLGVGVQPPTADWGIMAADGRAVLRNAPWVSLIPGLMIVIVSVACNFAGDGLRDALDPRQRRKR